MATKSGSWGAGVTFIMFLLNTGGIILLDEPLSHPDSEVDVA